MSSVSVNKNAVSFDTLLFSKAMKEAGMSEKTAEALAEELKKFREAGELATKGDIDLLQNNIQKEMQILEQKLIMKLGSFIAVAVGILAVIIKLN